MHALTFHRFGGPEVLEWTVVDDPNPTESQALVRMSVVGLNLADVYRRKGNYHLEGNPPWILGYEGAGIVDRAPSNPALAALFPVGTRVAFADSPFANAELVAVDADRLIQLPADVSDEVAAAILLQGLTAQFLVSDSYSVKPGSVALVYAAAGGVGQLLTQMLKNKGAKVIGVTSSASKRKIALEAGADVVVDYSTCAAEVSSFTGGRGVDVTYDSIGSTLPSSLDMTRVGGTVVFFGMADGDPPSINPRLLMDRSLTLAGADLWNILTSGEIRRDRASKLFEQVRSGHLRVSIAAKYPLKNGAEAHRFLEGRSATGKVLMFV